MPASSWRSVAATAGWVSAALRGEAGVEQVLDVLTALEALSPVQPAGTDGREHLLHSIARWRRMGITGWWYAPVEPGAVAGVPRNVQAAALAPGAAVVSLDGASLCLVPDDSLLRELVTDDHGHPPVDSVADADRHLLEALSAATSALAALDVASWDPAASPLVGVSVPLPPGSGTRAERLAERSQVVLAATEVALRDGGGSRSSTEVLRRANILREARRSARQAHSVAWNAAALRWARAR